MKQTLKEFKTALLTFLCIVIHTTSYFSFCIFLQLFISFLKTYRKKFFFRALYLIFLVHAHKKSELNNERKGWPHKDK